MYRIVQNFQGGDPLGAVRREFLAVGAVRGLFEAGEPLANDPKRASVSLASDSEEMPAGDEFDSAFEDRTADRSLPTTASKCAVATVFPSDAPVAYNHAYGVPCREAGRFPLTGNYSTTI